MSAQKCTNQQCNTYDQPADDQTAERYVRQHTAKMFLQQRSRAHIDFELFTY